MLKKAITYTDFNGDERTDVVYFNLTEAELIDMQISSERGIEKDMEDAIASKDVRRILDFIKTLVHHAYGVKSEDGRHFRKSDEIREEFISSALYNELLLSLFKNEGRDAVSFITGLMPKSLVEGALKKMGATTTPTDEIPEVKPSAREIFDASKLPDSRDELADFEAWRAARRAEENKNE